MIKPMVELYEGLDWALRYQIEKGVAAGGPPTSCTKGCAACCHIMALITIPEAVHALLGAMANGFKPEEHEGQLADLVAEACKPDMNNNKWFQEKRRPCLLLGADNMCRAYEARPTACRVYYVITPPEQCSWTNPTKEVGSLNLFQFQAAALMSMDGIARWMGLPSLGISPMPVALHVGIIYLRDGVIAARREMKRLGIDDMDKAYEQAKRFSDGRPEGLIQPMWEQRADGARR